ncbi:MAG: cell division protein FtsQ/DivIB [Pseudomonadota bacterium]
MRFFAQADPAPSRIAYRLERMWLRPSIRRACRIGLPLGALAAILGWWASDAARIELLRDTAAEMQRAVEERPEFMVRLMAVDGASPELSHAIHESIHIGFPVSSFDIELDAIRAEIAALDAVAEVRVRIRPGGILQVDITEREPALIWRSNAGLILVDATGHPIAATQARADWPELPLIAGDGAHHAAEEALALFAATAPLAERVRGLQRRGARRWDIVLTDSQRIMLPETGPVAALEYVLALDAARDLLSRDVSDIDLRLAERPTLRLSPFAQDELNRIRAPRASGPAPGAANP